MTTLMAFSENDKITKLGLSQEPEGSDVYQRVNWMSPSEQDLSAGYSELVLNSSFLAAAAAHQVSPRTLLARLDPDNRHEACMSDIGPVMRQMHRFGFLNPGTGAVPVQLMFSDVPAASTLLNLAVGEVLSLVPVHPEYASEVYDPVRLLADVPGGGSANTSLVMLSVVPPNPHTVANVTPGVFGGTYTMTGARVTGSVEPHVITVAMPEPGVMEGMLVPQWLKSLDEIGRIDRIRLFDALVSAYVSGASKWGLGQLTPELVTSYDSSISTAMTMTPVALARMKLKWQLLGMNPSIVLGDEATVMAFVRGCAADPSLDLAKIQGTQVTLGLPKITVGIEATPMSAVAVRAGVTAPGDLLFLDPRQGLTGIVGRDWVKQFTDPLGRQMFTYSEMRGFRPSGGIPYGAVIRLALA